MEMGFRIQSVAISGFKGFTTQKEIHLEGRHAFLLGQNGNGKSSIIEALRWGLFGSTGRPNEIVANRDYTGQCRVNIALMREGKLLNLRRTLIRGSSGGSDARLTDEQGQEHPIRDIMPQLDSVDAGEGMHIIFAPQAIPLRRQPEDLTAFEKTVLNYLGLTHPRALLSQMNSFLVDMELVERDLGDQLTDVRQQFENQIENLTNERGDILRLRHWGSGHPPSAVDSENKARELIAEITGAQPQESLAGLSLSALTDKAEADLDDRYSQDQVELEDKMEAITERKNSIEELRDVLNNIEEQRSLIRDSQAKHDAILDEMSLPELRSCVNKTREQLAEKDLGRRIVELTNEFLTHHQTESVSCPVCDNVNLRLDLEAALRRKSDLRDDNVISRLRQLESRLAQAEELERDVQRLTAEFGNIEDKANTVRSGITLDDSKEASELGSLEKLDSQIYRCSVQNASIAAQIDNRREWFDGMKLRLSNLRKEATFHEINSELAQLQRTKNQFEVVKNSYQDLVSFGESVRNIRQSVESCLRESLVEVLPRVCMNLSRVFSALTHHPWFDQLKIAQDTLPTLELRVSSSRDLSGNEHPTGVLNGQAESALELVPYFAFSQADKAPTEVYLVLLDDPTRAFDEEHTEILVERLAELGNHVQLMVASQETVRFRELLPENFERKSYVVIEPTRWSYRDGPDLEIEYE